ncbi:MAG TPA: hypothetical protein VFZ73_09170 [Gemmatimonadaceae bacterium]
MPAKSAATTQSVVANPMLWGAAWFVAWIGARIALESTAMPPWLRIVAALAPAPLAAAALFTLVRAARELDELERRIQLEALAFAFVLSMLLLMTLGLMELAIVLNRDDWSYRHVWAMLPTLYLVGLILARRRYA